MKINRNDKDRRRSMFKYGTTLIGRYGSLTTGSVSAISIMNGA